MCEGFLGNSMWMGVLDVCRHLNVPSDCPLGPEPSRDTLGAQLLHYSLKSVVQRE